MVPRRSKLAGAADTLADPSPRPPFAERARPTESARGAGKPVEAYSAPAPVNDPAHDDYAKLDDSTEDEYISEAFEQLGAIAEQQKQEALREELQQSRAREEAERKAREREEAARKLREQEEAARRELEREEAARKLREQEEAERRELEREEAARKFREQEEAARKFREQQERDRKAREKEERERKELEKKAKEEEDRKQQRQREQLLMVQHLQTEKRRIEDLKMQQRLEQEQKRLENERKLLEQERQQLKAIQSISAAAAKAVPEAATRLTYQAVVDTLEVGAKVRHKISKVEGVITNGFKDGAYVKWGNHHNPTFHIWTELEQLRKLTPLEFYESESARLNKELQVAAVEKEDYVAAQRIQQEIQALNAKYQHLKPKAGGHTSAESLPECVETKLRELQSEMSKYAQDQDFAKAGAMKKQIAALLKQADAIKKLEAQVEDCVRAKRFGDADILQQQIQRLLDGERRSSAPESESSLQQQMLNYTQTGQKDKAQEVACKLYLFNLEKKNKISASSPHVPYTDPKLRDLENRLQQCVRSGDMAQARVLLEQIRLFKSNDPRMRALSSSPKPPKPQNLHAGWSPTSGSPKANPWGSYRPPPNPRSMYGPPLGQAQMDFLSRKLPTLYDLCKAGDAMQLEARLIELGPHVADVLNTPHPKFGSTPMHGAAWFVKLDCVRMLIKYGARIDVRNGKGHTAHEEASIGTGASTELKDFFDAKSKYDAWRKNNPMQ